MRCSISQGIRKCNRFCLGLITLLMLPLLAAAQTTIGPDASGYKATNATAFSFINISSTGTSVLAGADDSSAVVNLGFSFTFYGQTYTSACISSNGLISFGGCNADFANVDLSAASPTGNLPTIAPFWMDLTFAAPGAGSVFYQTMGTAPNRAFVAQWNNAFPVNAAKGVTFQVILSEATGQILFQYQDLNAGVGSPASFGALATAGIRNSGGQSNGSELQWSNDAAVLTNLEAIQFTAPPPPPAGTGGGGSGGGGGGGVISTVTLSLSSSNLIFTAQVGGSNPPVQVVNIVTSGGTPIWSAAITSITPGNWLTLTSDVPDGTLTVAVASTSLAAGSYSATVTISAVGVNPQTLTITLNVTPQPVLTLGSSALNFSSAAGTTPDSQQLTISSSSGVSNWTATVTTSSGGNWLIISANSGTTPSSLTVSVNTAGLAPGSYQGTISVSSGSNSPLQVTVALTITAAPPATQPPVVPAAGITNAASYAAGVTAGGIVSIFGTGLTSGVSGIVSATGLPLPTSLRGTSVTVNGIPAPLFAIANVNGQEQINLQIPNVVAGSNTVTIVVTNNGQVGASIQVPILAVQPGIFSADSSGKGPAAALNQDLSFNSAQNPIPAGNVIVLYATGLGGTNPPVAAGQPAPTSPLSFTVGTPVVLINGVQAEVQYSGLAPTFVGLYQINAVVPAGTPAGNVPAQIQIGAGTSNTVTIAVQ